MSTVEVPGDPPPSPSVLRSRSPHEPTLPRSRDGSSSPSNGLLFWGGSFKLTGCQQTKILQLPGRHIDDTGGNPKPFIRNTLHPSSTAEPP
ncbi:hypothetical protein DPEC_G00065750 [Dallia pectoralis]|uniref:Uncharacterized protein n=1 Tax=Dallia pectoralis TaxID=75939 RepID=A0ACC2H945_DALPE|nr:hypothetical protein DPEC_G00065750 [Dallia pectoralis]